jgi:hypothetical protein
MKHKGLIILAISYFALLCIQYVWNFPIYVLLAIGFITLLTVLIRQFYFINKESFINKWRIYAAGLLFIVLMSTFLLPILNSSNSNRRSVMDIEYGEAKREVSFQLKENGTFQYYIEGQRPIEGKYESYEDTIIFKDTDNTEFPQFVILDIPAFQDSKFCGQITLYKNDRDSTGVTHNINKLRMRRSR